MRQRRPTRRHSAFTLVELLIVIGLIVVLVGILLPVVGRVKTAGYRASCSAQIQSLSSLIDAYYSDFSAYPGPLGYQQVYSQQGMNSVNPAITHVPMSPAWNPEVITGTENLVLGLVGGLRRNATTAAIEYSTDWVGKGPGSLGTSPKKLPAYGDMSDVAIRRTVSPIDGDYVDDNGTTGFDSLVPEYVDRFPEAMPLLYLRARPGQRPNMSTPASNPVATDGSRIGQYDTTQVYGYVNGNSAQAIGAGKGLSASEYVGYTQALQPQGLQTAAYGSSSSPNSAGYTYPYNLYAAVRHPTLDSAATPTPKQKDRYILISAGADRVYGTSDDVTNFGAY